MESILQISFDWASARHAFAWHDCVSNEHLEGYVDAQPSKVKDWIEALRRRFPAHRFEIILEMTKGPLIWQLKDYQFIDLFPLSPVASANFRKCFRPSGAKDDPGDALLWLEYLQKHREKLRILRHGSANAITLDRLTTGRRRFVDEVTRLTNELKAVLDEFYPEAMEMMGEPTSPIAGAFFKRWPRPEELARAKEATLRNFYYMRRVRHTKTIDKRLAMAAAIRPATSDEALVETAILRVASLLALLEKLGRIIDDYDQRLAQALKACEPAKKAVLESLPGAGKALQPRLYVALEALHRIVDEDAEAAAAFCGVAPVGAKSGKKQIVRRRMARPKFLHQTLIEYAHHSRRNCTWASAFYQARKTRGDGHNTILRALAMKWLRIILRCWVDQKPYNDEQYLQRLSSKGSPFAIAQSKAA